MPRNRIPTPASTAAVHQKSPLPGYKERGNGAIRATGPVLAPRIKPNAKPRQGIKKSVYWNK